MPVQPEYLSTSIEHQLLSLLPQRLTPAASGRPRIDERLVFHALLEMLLTGNSYRQAARPGLSATTLRRHRDQWIAAGVMASLERAVRAHYDEIVGLRLADISIDGCYAKAPSGGAIAGRCPVDRGKLGYKRSLAVDAVGTPLATITAPANAHDSPLLEPTLKATMESVSLPAGCTVHLDRGYDSAVTRAKLQSRGLCCDIARNGISTSLRTSGRWVVERTHSWHNHYRKLIRCTERNPAPLAFWIAFATACLVCKRMFNEIRRVAQQSRLQGFAR